jgi:lipopolysaccharide transport system ATP-binding protein
MYVRLAFAVAAFLEPEILIVDEVLAVGDAEFQKKCLGRMKDVSVNDGRTVLFVSHNMAAVSSLCNTGIVLQNGILSFDGSSINAVANYQKSNNSESNEKSSWNSIEAQGDYRAKILEAYAFPTIGDQFNFGSGITLYFKIESSISKASLDISFNIKNQEEILLFHHGNYVASHLELKKGIYEVNVQIPPAMLNEGLYYVDVWMGLGATEIVGKVLSKALSFYVEKSNIDHIIKSLPGIIRPKLNYEIRYGA